MSDPPVSPRGNFRDAAVPDPYSYRSGLADPDRHLAYAWAASMAAGRRVLDIGCGSGDGSVRLLEAGASSVVGIDPIVSRIEEATRIHGGRCRFQRTDPGAPDLAAGSFDLICCLGLLDDAPDPRAVIESAQRLLAAGGILLASLRGEPGRAAKVFDGFANRAIFGLSFQATLSRLDGGGGTAPADHGGDGASTESEDQAEATSEPASGASTLLIAASEDELPATATTLPLGETELDAYRTALVSWEERARRAEAEGSAKHWELVAAREAQRRLRKRLHVLEHRPLRILTRVVRGRPARLGPGPPLRASEQPPDSWS